MNKGIKMTLKESTRWELTATATGLALVFLNPLAFWLGRYMFGVSYANEGLTPTPLALAIHLAMMFFIFYVLLRVVNWQTDC